MGGKGVPQRALPEAMALPRYSPAIFYEELKPDPAKCPGCGSHEWRQHNNVRICAYCRSGQ